MENQAPKNIYYAEGNRQMGPYTFEELRREPIRPDTLIWYPGLSNWVRADVLPELQVWFAPVMPPQYAPAQPPQYAPAAAPSQNPAPQMPQKRGNIWYSKAVLILSAIGIGLSSIMLSLSIFVTVIPDIDGFYDSYYRKYYYSYGVDTEWGFAYILFSLFTMFLCIMLLITMIRAKKALRNAPLYR